MVKDKPLIVFGKHQFVAEEDDEIEFKTGDPILVLEKDEEFNDGWWKGRTMKGEVGLFPVNFTTNENIFNVNVNSLIEAAQRIDSSNVQNIIDDDNYQSSKANNNSDYFVNNNNDKEIHKNSSGLENRTSSPNGSINSMRPVSSPKLSTSLPNNYRVMGGDLGRNDASKNKLYSNQLSQSQSNISKQNSGSKGINPNNKSKKPEEWNVDEVCDWFVSINYEKIIPAVKENKITGEKLLELNLSKLRDFGIHSLPERIELLHKILSLREESTNTNNVFKYKNDIMNNESTYTSDYESYNGSVKYNRKYINQKMQKPSSTFEFYDRVDGYESEPYRMSKPSKYSEGFRSNLNNDKRHHELPVSTNFYQSPEIPNTTINVNNHLSSSSYGGGMVGITGLPMGMRNRSLSLQDNLQYGGNINPTNMALPLLPNEEINNKSNFNFQNAERKGWLYVRFDNEMNWNRRWVVILDTRLFILKSSTEQENNDFNGVRVPEILLTVELNPNCVILPDFGDKSKPHNFLLQDPRLGSIHLAADDQLGVVTWINFIVRASTNTQKKPMPLIPLKNIGRQAKETLQTISAQESSYENESAGYNSNMSRKNSTSMSANGIRSPNIKSDYPYSIKSVENDSFGTLLNKTNSLRSIKTNPLSPKINTVSPISPTQTAAAAANGWFRTNAKSATDYSNYRNLKQVSQETRLKLQKTAKLTEPVIMTPILKANKLKSFNPNQIDSEDDFGMLSDGGMKGMNYHKKPEFMKNPFSGFNNGPYNKHTSISSSYIGYGQNNFSQSNFSQNNFSQSNFSQNTFSQNSYAPNNYTPGNYTPNNQVSAIEMMERRGIGSFVNSSQSKGRKMSKSSKKNSILFW